MKSKLKNYDYEKYVGQGTGSHKEERKTIVFPFDKYQIKIALTPDDKFIEISEIKINKDFLSYKQKLISKGPKGYHDVDEFYKDLDE